MAVTTYPRSRAALFINDLLAAMRLPHPYVGDGHLSLSLSDQALVRRYDTPLPVDP